MTNHTHPKHERPLVAVIGAGVVGLTTALLLQCNHYDVTIISDEFPWEDKPRPDYASPKAGAHWRSMCDEDDERAKVSSEKHGTFQELAKNPESGINIRDAIDYFDFNPTGHEGRDPWWSKVVDDFKKIPSTNAAFPIAYSYKTPVITPNIYLKFLLHQFKQAGGHVQHRKLSHVTEAALWVGTKPRPVKIIVNCTGFQARHLGGVNDLRNFQTRGQTAVVRASWIHETVTWISKSGSIMYVIPRSNGDVVLGGSHEAYQKYPKILTPGSSAAYAASPDLLSKFDIVDQKVGFRPSRIGGVRVEVEHGRTGTGQHVLIAHNYGHGGAGYQSSWGTAQDTLELIQKAEKETVDEQPTEFARL
ncbi:nucleotide-binding domain-containing protein [Linnemannia elongata AG-77]|uniref:Nucleotide-binding domain-containing protein n=1 Tax=Linnemannia elongata AG-77 TaxID=1314771 RepID=A0A197K0Q9_9FUNG|nr:nucleotide-binding domain-containing protein [Linnemannia elongata AG-77]